MQGEQAFRIHADMMLVANPVAATLAPLMSRFGWTVEDCKQEAALKLWGLLLTGTYPLDPPLWSACVRNHLLNVADRLGHRTVSETGEAVAEPVAREQFIPGWTKTEWDDALATLERIEPDTAAYLRMRIEEGKTWRQIQKALNRDMADLKSSAGEWLMAQIEGRRTKSG